MNLPLEGETHGKILSIKNLKLISFQITLIVFQFLKVWLQYMAEITIVLTL
jgi:hypothetical protein